jgi:hypothetical protein
VSAAELARKAAAATGEASVVLKLAEARVRRLGTQLNWANSAAVELLRDRPGDPLATTNAVAILEEVVAITPHASTLRINLSSALTNLGRHDEAIARVLESERIMRDRGLVINAQRILQAAGTFRRAGQLKEATRRIDEADAQIREGSDPPDVKESLLLTIAQERRLLAEAGANQR